MIRYSKGCHLDRGRTRFTPFEVAKMRGMASAPLPASIDLEPFAPPVVDQTEFSACEGCSSSSAIYTTLNNAGTPLGWVPSQSEIYRLARCVDRRSPSQRLTDDGTMTEAVIRAISEFGIRPMVQDIAGTHCDLASSSINSEPFLSDLERDSHSLMLGAYQITSSGSQKIHDVKAALASGFAVRVDTEVDSAFEDWTSSKAPYGVPKASDILGGHAVFCVGYTASGVFVIRNSWSAGWGAAGNLHASEAFIAQADCYAWSVRRS